MKKKSLSFSFLLEGARKNRFVSTWGRYDGVLGGLLKGASGVTKTGWFFWCFCHGQSLLFGGRRTLLWRCVTFRAFWDGTMFASAVNGKGFWWWVLVDGLPEVRKRGVSMGVVEGICVCDPNRMPTRASRHHGRLGEQTLFPVAAVHFPLPPRHSSLVNPNPNFPLR